MEVPWSAGVCMVRTEDLSSEDLSSEDYTLAPEPVSVLSFIALHYE